MCHILPYDRNTSAIYWWPALMAKWTKVLPLTTHNLTTACLSLNPGHGIWESCQWLTGCVVVAVGYSGFLHHLQLAIHNLGIMWQKSDETRNGRFQMPPIDQVVVKLTAALQLTTKGHSSNTHAYHKTSWFRVLPWSVRHLGTNHFDHRNPRNHISVHPDTSVRNLWSCQIQACTVYHCLSCTV